MTRRHEIDFTVGPMLKKIILYALPIVGVNVLQLLFTTADVAVLGIFTNDFAVAAVGATTQIVNLMIGFFVGLSIGANVLIARCVGARDKEKSRRFVGTSVLISLIFGVVVMIVGVLLAEQMLVWTSCAPTVLPYAKKYLQIYFIGMPVIMLYNFSAAILRAVGDTLRPMIFLIVGGVVNVVLNIFFVIVVGLDIEGVAIATVASNLISAVCAFVLMVKNDGYAKIEKKHFRIYSREFKEIFVIGFPLALSKCLFSFSNTIVQSSINSLGDMVMTAHSITKEFDGFILEAVHGFGTANLAVISQNYGAKNMKRVKKAALLSMALMMGVSLSLGVILYFAGATLCGIMTDTEQVIEYCMVRITTISMLYFILGALNIVQEVIRGIGYSFTSLMLSITANILLRIIYIYLVYPLIYIEGNTAHNLRMLYILYPVSWLISTAIGVIIMIVLYRRVKARFEREEVAENKEIAVEEQIA